ncbi:MAG: hypothetical protein JO216_03950 [Hyphomicrobiales bacterium]|nr:hypothetical protein [Hyphomicrobiales bacterium]
MSATRKKTDARSSKRDAKRVPGRKRTKAKSSTDAKSSTERDLAEQTLALIAAPRAKGQKALTKSVTREWVLERLAENVRRAMRIEAVTLRGQPTGEFRYEGSVANRALELLGKQLGLFVERSESANTHHVVSGEPISEAKWEERYAKGE